VRSAVDGLTPEEIGAIANAFPDLGSASALVVAAGLERGLHPSWGVQSAYGFWSEVSALVQNGIRPGLRSALLAEAYRRFPGNAGFAEGTNSRTPPADGRTAPWMVPRFSTSLVARPALEAELIAALLDPAGPAVGMTAGVEGEGGFGKTALAATVCARSEVRDAFPGGVLWVEVGQERNGPLLTGLLDDLAVTLGAAPTGLSDPTAAAARVARLLTSRLPVLLVVDDVWRPTQLAPFLVLGEVCRLLVTTRIRRVLPVGARSVLVEHMTDAEASATLCQHVGELPAGVVRRLLDLTGRWPLLLAPAGRRIADAVASQAEPEQAARRLADQLAGGGPGVLDVRDAAARACGIESVLAASLSVLTDTERRCFSALAIFPEDTYIPYEVIALLWSQTGELDAYAAEALCDVLVEYRVGRRHWSKIGPALGLHDVLRAHLRRGLGPAGLREAHRAFVVAVRARLAGDAQNCRAELPEGAVGDYLTRQFVRHLIDAAYVDEATMLACDPQWIEGSLRRAGSTVAIENDLAAVGGEWAAQLSRLLVQNAHLFTGPLPAGGLGPTLAAQLATVPDLASIAEAYSRTLVRPYLDVVWSTYQTNPAQRRVLTANARYVNAVAFSPHGGLLATGGEDPTVRLWHVASGAERAALTGHASAVHAVAYSPDGRLLATGSKDKTARLWDTVTLTERAVLIGHTENVRAVAFSPDGSLLATGSDDGAIRFWDVASGRKQVAVLAHGSGVYSVDFSPDGKLLATSGEGTVRLWDVTTGTPRGVMTGHTGWVFAVRFSPDGELFATGGDDRAVRLWDVKSGTERAALLGHMHAVWAVAFSPDGGLLATGGRDETTRIWDLSSGIERTVLTSHTFGVHTVDFSPDGELLATGGADRTVRVWDVATKSKEVARSGHTGWDFTVGFSPDGSLLAAAGEDGLIRLRDTATGTERQVLRGHSGRVFAVKFSPDCGLIATAGWDDRTLRLWDVATGTAQFDLAAHTAGVRAVDFSPDGHLLASGGGDETARIWQVSTGEERTTLAGHGGTVTDVVFSPDGRLLATAADSDDHTVRLWDIATGTETAVLTGHEGPLWALAFSPDGTLLAGGGADQTVRLWDIATSTQRMTLKAHTLIRVMAFSPDGELLATGGDDEMVRLWDVATGTTATALRFAVQITAVDWRDDLIACAGAFGVALLRCHR
jgi:WD40 repeat protein